jgi:hypothetical protein
MGTLRVSEQWRTNPLSLKPGGHNVTVLWEDGKSFVYDKVKIPKNYVSHIAKKTSKHGNMLEVWVDDQLVWKREDRASTDQAWLDFLSV